MEILSAEIVTDILELPMPALLAMMSTGLLLAITGWKWHRFWLTLCVSLIAGLIGMRQASAWGISQPVVSGVLLAAAAGCLALSLSRVGLFLAYGLACWYTMKRLAPPYAIPAICICAGGLFSALFYRFCVVLLTSAIGSVVLCYGAIAYVEQQKWYAALNWLKDQSLVAHAALAGVILLSLFIQLALCRKSKKKKLADYTAHEIEAERRLGFPIRNRVA